MSRTIDPLISLLISSRRGGPPRWCDGELQHSSLRHYRLSLALASAQRLFRCSSVSRTCSSTWPGTLRRTCPRDLFPILCDSTGPHVDFRERVLQVALVLTRRQSNHSGKVHDRDHRSNKCKVDARRGVGCAMTGLRHRSSSSLAHLPLRKRGIAPAISHVRPFPGFSLACYSTVAPFTSRASSDIRATNGLGRALVSVAAGKTALCHLNV